MNLDLSILPTFFVAIAIISMIALKILEKKLKDKEGKEGDTRIKKGFIFYKKIGNETRYMCIASWKEVHKDTDWLSWDTTSEWTPTEWVS